MCVRTTGWPQRDDAGGGARPGERVGIILSGGNVDPERLAQLFAAAPTPG
jgi:hypothetical protein